ncbi:aminopeptidase P family protein [Paraferrimonas sedimenticola]|uniref:Xaa-Pro aminopeptidase n=1 Tax=Paraferrimonas sedimenticola TaxID=375674 RepID=A0AA37VYP1_9GAMM|nr:aminopeptidase P family protein [Paraferrimonas sedimenticola]GLP95545.1 Xaa-Pro aminopeptidase [Paraferrimonas sedimenticola]
MSQIIASRLAAIRELMAKQQLDAFVIPRADEYLGEYVPEHNERLLWATDFTGSAGHAVILADSAAIFVDGRYTVQVQSQVDGELFGYQSLTDDPLGAWLIDNMSRGQTVGVDARVHTLADFQSLQLELEKAGLQLSAVEQNPVDSAWNDRPAAPSQPIFCFDDASAGASSLQKRQQIGELVAKAQADVALISALDSIAWLTNLRSHNIPRLPALLGSALLHANGDMQVFLDVELIEAAAVEHVGKGVSFHPESDFAAALDGLKDVKLLADPNSSNAWGQLRAQSAGASLIAGADPVALVKAQKNPVELNGLRQAHRRDGVAVTRFLAWLDSEVAAGRLYDEGQLSDKLAEFRAPMDKYQEPSFDTISAAGANAAMCHYNHNNGTPAMLPMNSLYLVDSGGQYLDGTTDVTRTIAIGDITDEQRERATLVLKGHIALDQAKFPKGTSGQQLDALARLPLWQQGLDYDHGTGHGVGHFLSVHEGPQRIAKNANGVPLLEGMVLSNEPGYYQADGYGIRLENLVAVRRCEALAHSERHMLEFEALTLIPFDLRIFDAELLTRAERDWLNDYHQLVYQALSPELTGSDLAWLKQATRAL